MYLEFFGLREKPFGLTPDPKFLFFSEKHREALDHLLYGIHQKEGFVLISGDTGTGKTTLCRALLERLDRLLEPPEKSCWMCSIAFSLKLWLLEKQRF
jgi:general secretion pathway protein A